MGLLENAQAAARLSYELYQTLVTLNTEVIALVRENEMLKEKAERLQNGKAT